MKKPLDNFTVERLEEFIRQPLENGLTRIEQMELVRIALAAKRVEPEWYVVITSVGVWQSRYKTRSEAESHIKPWHKDYWIKELYTTPQLNSPEIPEGWKLAPLNPTAAMMAAAMECDDVVYDKDDDSIFCVQFDNIYAAMLAAALESNHD